MTKHAFLKGWVLAVLAGVAIGMAVTAKSMQSPDAPMGSAKRPQDGPHEGRLADTLGSVSKEVRLKAAPLFILDFHFIYVIFNIIKPK